MPVELTGTLETVSEIGVALAGFSGIVTALSDRADQPWGPANWYRLKALLIWSLGAALLAVLWFLFMAAITFSLLLLPRAVKRPST